MVKIMADRDVYTLFKEKLGVMVDEKLKQLGLGLLSGLKELIQDKQFEQEMIDIIIHEFNSYINHGFLSFDKDTYIKEIVEKFPVIFTKLKNTNGLEWENIKTRNIKYIVNSSFFVSDKDDEALRIESNKSISNRISEEKAHITNLTDKLFDAYYSYQRNKRTEPITLYTGEIESSFYTNCKWMKDEVEETRRIIVDGNSKILDEVKKRNVSEEYHSYKASYLFEYNLIPRRLYDVLKKNALYESIVIETILKRKELDYTSCIFDYCNSYRDKRTKEYLSIIDMLISDNSISKVSSLDVAVMILSVLYSDLSIGISLDLFRYLITNEYKDKWAEYISNLKKLKIEDISMTFAAPVELVRLDELYNGDFDDDYIIENPLCRRIICDFIKMNYYDISCLIATHNTYMNLYSGDSSMPWKCSNNTENAIYKDMLRSLVGMVLKCEGYDEYEQIDYQLNHSNIYGMNVAYANDCAIYYIIYLLKLTSFFYINFESCPEYYWIKNTIMECDGIQNSDYDMKIELGYDCSDVYRLYHNTDERRIRIMISNISDSHNYHCLKMWKETIQSEINKETNILLTIYKNSHDLSISFFELCILNDQDYNFSLEPITMKTDSSIFPLLIHKIYDDDVWSGVREILQNSIDACRKRKLEDPNYEEPQIVISLDTSSGKLSVSDNGVGMQENVIRKYFLSIGKSYYDSAEWRQQYTDNDGDDLIPHIGCYGIGKLAYFMLSDEYLVRTCYYSDDCGWEFKVIKNDILLSKSIELKKYNGNYSSGALEKGTTVSMNLKKRVLHNQELMNHSCWMRLIDVSESEITVLCEIDEERFLINNYYYPVRWYCIYSSKGYSVYVSYDEYALSSLNGIVVPQKIYSAKIRIESYCSLDFVDVNRKRFNSIVHNHYKTWLINSLKLFIETMEWHILDFCKFYYNADYVCFPKESQQYIVHYYLEDLSTYENVQEIECRRFSNYDDIRSFISKGYYIKSNHIDERDDYHASWVVSDPEKFKSEYLYNFDLKSNLTNNVEEINFDDEGNLLIQYGYGDLKNPERHQYKSYEFVPKKDIYDRFIKVGDRILFFTSSLYHDFFPEHPTTNLLDDSSDEYKFYFIDMNNTNEIDPKSMKFLRTHIDKIMSDLIQFVM